MCVFKKSLFFIVLVFISLNVFAQKNNTTYIFGNSLIVHDPPAITTPSNETTVPHWLHFLAQEAGHSFSTSGQYGFLQQHDNLPPFSQWGFDSVLPAWDSDIENFTDANFNSILVTAGNFIQDQPSNLAYYNDPNTTPVSATLTILDWIDNQEPNAVTYIYENWPDMAAFIAGQSFPPTASEFQNYNTFTQNGFHNWWLEYQDFLLSARPNENVRMIPVGLILSKLLSQSPLNQISITDLYEDNAPHGRPTLYFLASLVTYMALYEEQAPTTFVIPSTVDNMVTSNYSFINNFIWTELLAFNNTNGDSRVFVNNPNLGIDETELLINIKLFPNPTNGIISFSTNLVNTRITCYNIQGQEVQLTLNKNQIDLSKLSNGVWFLKFYNKDFSVVKKIIKY